MTPDELSTVRVIQGHSVGSAVLQRLDPQVDLKLMVVLRDPVSHTRSRFNHRSKAMQRRGRELSEEAFISSEVGNAITRNLQKRFPEFIDDLNSEPFQDISSILGKFDYVLATEAIDQQAPSVMRFFGLPEQMERRRVAEAKRELSLTDEEIMQMNHADLAAHKLAVRTLDTDGSSYNAFGLDVASKARAIEQVRVNRMGDDEVRTSAYAELAKALVKVLEVEAALVRLDASDPVALRDPDLFKQNLVKLWEKARPKLSQAQVDLSASKKNRWARKYKRTAASNGLGQLETSCS